MEDKILMLELQQLKISEVELDKLVSQLIQSIRLGNFPKLFTLKLSGYTSEKYCHTQVPNVK